MKKCIAVLMALLMFVSAFQMMAMAAPADTNVPPADADAFEIVGDTYYTYLQQHKGYADAKKDDEVALKGNQYTSSDGADIKKLDGAREDDNGVSKDGLIQWSGEKGTVTYTFDVKKKGMYEIQLTYLPIEGRGLPLSFDFFIDGKQPYESLSRVSFERTWKDKKPDGVKDDAGNIYSSEQIETFIYKTMSANERTGQYVDPIKLALDEGQHTLSIKALAGEFYLAEVRLAAPEQVLSYAQYKNKYSGAKKYNGKEIHIEGEKATYKSTASLNPLIDNSDPSVYPTEPFKELINYIGSTGWQSAGETLTWEVNVPQDGLYRIGFRYRQNVVINGNSYRHLKVDGQTPFAEAKNIAFGYGGNWQFKELQVNDENPMYLYLTKGKHQLSLTVTLGEMGEIGRAVNDVTYKIGDLYLKMKMLTGEQVDINRSYEFDKNIPGFMDTLNECIAELDRICKRVEEITGEKSGTYVATMQNMSRVMKKMKDNVFLAQKSVNDYYTQYCSLAALVTDLAEMPLDLDQIVLAPQGGYEQKLAGWWDKLVFSCERLVTSFMDDYKYTSDSADGKRTLTLWVTWGRDQTQILTSLVKDSFETQYPDVRVNVQIVGASLIQAILIGDGPDVLLGQVRTEPVNYGMRNALVDLRQFDDYEQVVKERFQEGATKPYELGNATYGLPDTQAFNIMFYRTDIFEQMGLNGDNIKTWDDFRDATALLQRQNLQAGFGAPQSADIGVIDSFSTFLKQANVDLYKTNAKGELVGVNFSDNVAIDRFVYWTQFFTELGFEQSFDFYNRFRSGTMPLGVAGYSQYVLFSQAAPEIAGKWDIALAPGTAVKDKDGNPVLDEEGNPVINYTQADSGTACVIPKIADDKQLAWEFLKWWTDESTQYRYSTMVEAVLGEVGRVTTSNKHAFERLTWESDHLDTLKLAWENVDALEQVPGGYYVARSVYQAFWNVVNQSENPKDMIVHWGKIADKEIERKRGEYANEIAKHYK